MIVLGIDPGLATIGYGVVDFGPEWRALSYGCVKTGAETPTEVRLKEIFERIQEIIKDHAPECLVIERQFFNRNITNAIAVGKASGVIALSAAMNRIPVIEVTPLEVKDALCGYGRAKKPEVGMMVKEMLGVTKITKDSGDALACALCYKIKMENKFLDQ